MPTDPTATAAVPIHALDTLSFWLDGDALVIAPHGPKLLDERLIAQMADELFRLVRVADRRQVILDFSRLTFVSSATLGKFLALHKRVAQAGGRLVLTGLDQSTIEVFRITKLDRVLTIAPTYPDALAAARQPPA